MRAAAAVCTTTLLAALRPCPAFVSVAEVGETYASRSRAWLTTMNYRYSRFQRSPVQSNGFLCRQALLSVFGILLRRAPALLVSLLLLLFGRKPQSCSPSLEPVHAIGDTYPNFSALDP